MGSILLLRVVLAANEIRSRVKGHLRRTNKYFQVDRVESV